MMFYNKYCKKSIIKILRAMAAVRMRDCNSLLTNNATLDQFWTNMDYAFDTDIGQLECNIEKPIWRPFHFLLGKTLLMNNKEMFDVGSLSFQNVHFGSLSQAEPCLEWPSLH